MSRPDFRVIRFSINDMQGVPLRQLRHGKLKTMLEVQAFCCDRFVTEARAEGT
ncbi:MAG: hypothetical protein ACJA1E_000488 [Paracoccaceae bacterium]